MKFSFFPLILCLILFFSCSSDDDINCSAASFAVQEFHIEVVDEDGNNLLANGTYDIEEVQVKVNNQVVSTIRENQDEVLIAIFENGAEARNNLDYEVILSPEEIDILKLHYSFEEAACTKIYTAEKAIYNGKEIEIQTTSGNQRITVVKELQ